MTFIVVLASSQSPNLLLEWSPFPFVKGLTHLSYEPRFNQGKAPFFTGRIGVQHLIGKGVRK